MKLQDIVKTSNHICDKYILEKRALKTKLFTIQCVHLLNETIKICVN